MIDELLQLILDDARDGMKKSVEHLATDLGTLRAGRASAAMLDGVRVEAYGVQSPLNQVANVSTPQHDLIVVQAYDRSTLKAVERAIIGANLGLNPTNDGTLIRLVVPPMTEERRRGLAKQARAKGEDAKVALRNVRREAKDEIKRTSRDENLPDDMQFDAEARLQKLTDEHIARVDAMLEKKEQEIMAV